MNDIFLPELFWYKSTLRNFSNYYCCLFGVDLNINIYVANWKSLKLLDIFTTCFQKFPLRINLFGFDTSLGNWYNLMWYYWLHESNRMNSKSILLRLWRGVSIQDTLTFTSYTWLVISQFYCCLKYMTSFLHRFLFLFKIND